jgi:diguanylate cyclase (GGDEF)-like protein/PAS domain S-box-containing protein
MRHTRSESETPAGAAEAALNARVNLRLLAIIWPFLLIAAMLAALAAVSMDVLSAARAYVGGESLWSKAEKEAVLYLGRYAESGLEQDYESYLANIAVPAGDRAARLELERPRPDDSVVRQGFIQGRNHARDIAGMIRLYRWFRHVSYIEAVIDIWAEGDRQIAALDDAARALHAQVAAGVRGPAELRPTLDRIRAINAALTPLEERFSYTLGEASRWTRDVLLATVLAATLLSALAGTVLSRRMIRRGVEFERALQASEERFDLAVAGSDDGIWDWNLMSGEFYISPRCKELIGYADAELPNLREEFESRLHPDDVERARRALAEQIESDVPYDVEYRLLTKSGEYRWFHARGRCVRGAGGKATRIAGSITDVTDRKLGAAQLSYQAAHDSLTGLVNRREFDRRLSHLLARVADDRHHFAVAFLDLDQFKVVNDLGGHAAGDELLRQLGPLLHSRLREGDTLARLGGDEFGVLLEHCRPQDAYKVADGLREIVANHKFAWQGQLLRVGVSIGVVDVGHPAPGIDEVLRAADEACYLAKNAGRNCVHVHDPREPKRAMRQSDTGWIERIRAALSQDRFTLLAQQIVALGQAADEQFRIEVSPCMLDEGGAPVASKLFMPAAERFELCGAIDRWVVRAALAQCAALRDLAGSGPALCVIELSGMSVEDGDLPIYVGEQLALHRVQPSTVCFKVTENLATRDLAAASRFVDAMRKLGCRSMLDAFGSSMISFSCIRHLPVEFVKIDASLVRNIDVDTASAALIEAIGGVCRALGRKTVAESAHSERVLAQLGLLGVDYAQGDAAGGTLPLPLADWRQARQPVA